ncbi:hypothetical protein CAC42_737 [Sphaceloma murrayae]|uniref:Uncharacterized protein n=1 Tax=Sphaceloma murrayae TaxID=2082308 RepID=A0A2K1QJZ2_9PEZI|nr:hypothetical protein CAC42_737 [Sphaceloma murrayae]
MDEPSSASTAIAELAVVSANQKGSTKDERKSHSIGSPYLYPLSPSNSWEALPAEIRRLVFVEYSRDDTQGFVIPCTPFPLILSTSKDIRNHGPSAFFESTSFAVSLFRHYEGKSDYTLPLHRLNARKYHNLPANTYFVSNLRIRPVSTRYCFECNNDTKLHPHCGHTQQIVIDFRGGVAATGLEEYYNNPAATPGVVKQYTTSFRVKQVDVTITHPSPVKKDVVKKGLEDLVDSLYGDLSGIEVTKLLNISVPASLFGPEPFVP